MLELTPIYNSYSTSFLPDSDIIHKTFVNQMLYYWEEIEKEYFLSINTTATFAPRKETFIEWLERKFFTPDSNTSWQRRIDKNKKTNE